MPRREDIEKFKEVVNSLGGEAEIMARRSQPIEDVLPPDEALPAPAGEPAGAPGAPLEAAGPGEEEAADFGLDLSDLDDSGPGPAEAPAAEQPELPSEEAGTAETPSPDETALDFGSLFAEEPAAPPIEETETPTEETGAEELPPIDLPAEGPAEPGEPLAEEFALPESESSLLQADLSQMEALPEDIGEQVAPSGEPEPLPEQAGPTGELEPSPEPTGEPEALGGLGAAGPASEEALAGIELPNLEDLSLTELQAGGEAEPRVGEPEEPVGETPQAPEPEAGQGVETAPEEGLGNLGLEEFTFTEPTGQFVEAEQPEAARPEAPAARRPARPAPREAAPLPELGGVEAEIALTRPQFDQLKRTLESLPRNLKLAVQEVIADGRAAGANLTRLISLLVAGAAAQEIASVVTRITGRRIVIPPGYEKRSGVAFEAERRTFAYALRENIYPMVRLFAVTVLAAALIGFFGYRVVYRPLAAAASYRTGYTHILGDRFTLANESFDRARRIFHIRKWYFRYAEAFSDRRQYVLAEQKYDQLLRDFPGDRKGVLDYARMESTALADFKKADDILKIILDKDQYDYDGLLAAGDNNLGWAATESSHYEMARLDYATLIDRYGTRDELLFRMLRYFIRTDNQQEIERLRLYFAARPNERVDPEAYAELGGYLIDHRMLDHAQEVLFKAEEARTGLAEVHYNLARYYRLTQRPDDELLALNAALKLLHPTDPLTPKRIAMEVDTHTRLGELFDVKGQYINGEKEILGAIALIEENQRNKLIAAGRLFGRPYADLGDLHYYIIGDLDTARSLYRKAIDNLYVDPSLDYKIGFTHYAAGDYVAALTSFAKAEEEWGVPRDPDAAPPIVQSGTQPVDYSGKAPVNLLYALGNAFYQRGDYFAAQGYYLRVRDRLETLRTALGDLFPREKPEQRSLLETLVKVNNNLGVTLDRLAARTGDRNKRSEALVYLADASETADTLTRAPDTRSTGGVRNLPFLNQRGILYPVSGFVPQISRDIPKDLGTLFW
ncbi:MAG TPA: hypothetical protein VMU36_10930 [Spirochaetia bacterium]|nr:hypothetical protein [Spirochaetia bacterium]